MTISDWLLFGAIALTIIAICGLAIAALSPLWVDRNHESCRPEKSSEKSKKHR